MRKPFDELTLPSQTTALNNVHPCTLFSYEFSFENSLLLSSPAIRGRSWKMNRYAKHSLSYS